MKVIVIGAGIVGANVAWRLTQKGADVTVVESGRPGGGTSGNSFAWVNSHRKPPRTYHDLNVRGMRAHRELCREFPDQTWWGGKGSLEWSRFGQAAVDFEAQVATFHAWDYKAEIIDRKRLAKLAPDIAADAFPEHQVAIFEEEGWVSPVLIVHRLLQAAETRGAEIRIMTGPASLVISGDKVTGVRLSSGEIEADAVVNCTGWCVNTVMDDHALHIPMGPTLGLLAFTPPVPANPEQVILGPECEIRSDGAGRLMLHSDEIDHRLTSGTSRDELHSFGAELVSRAGRLLPSIGGATVEAVRIGTRARPEDGLPAVGSLPGLEGYTVVATHSGVTLSAWLGQAVADEVFGGEIHHELADFRPHRFFGNARPAAQTWVRD